ncbi:MAG: hypothetical protein R3B48_09845 [Kofleriaceae bacterium]
MSLTRLVIAPLFLLMVIACTPVTLKPEFTAVGALGNPVAAVAVAANAEAVQVFYASSPAGFTLRENELKVEDGFNHRIIGIVKLRRAAGAFENCNVVQADAIAAMQQGAYTNGANAVVYATSPLATEPDQLICQRAFEAGEFGSGWAVVLGGGTPASAPPTPVAAPAAPPTTPAPPSAQ